MRSIPTGRCVWHASPSGVFVAHALPGMNGFGEEDVTLASDRRGEALQPVVRDPLGRYVEASVALALPSDGLFEPACLQDRRLTDAARAALQRAYAAAARRAGRGPGRSAPGVGRRTAGQLGAAGVVARRGAAGHRRGRRQRHACCCSVRCPRRASRRAARRRPPASTAWLGRVAPRLLERRAPRPDACRTCATCMRSRQSGCWAHARRRRRWPSCSCARGNR